MCETFDAAWQIVLIFLLFFSLLTILLRVKYSGRVNAGKAPAQPQWLAALVFWGAGLVGIIMLASMVLGFVCAGSPGDLRGIVPN